MRLVVFTFAFLVVISSSVCRAIIKVPAHVATNHQTAQRLPAESQFKQLLSRLRTQDKSVASVSNKKDVACDLVIAAVDSPAEPLTLFELAICGGELRLFKLSYL